MDQAADELGRQIVEVQRRLYAFILTLAPRRSEADDVLQETNVVLWAKRSEFTPGTNFWAWASRIAYLQVLALRKRQGRDRHQFDDLLIQELAAAAPDDFEARQQAMDQCLETLRPVDRELLDLRYRQNLQAPEIAALQSRSVNAVYQVLFRVRANLLRCIEQRLEREAE